VPGPLPREIPVPGGPRGHDAETVRDWLEKRIREICAAFDARNGNDWTTRWIEEIREDLHASFRPFPLPR
jgi:hypothetical protein